MVGLLPVDSPCDSLASQFGRKPAMYALWLILAISVTCESVAKQWQVWVREFQSPLRICELPLTRGSSLSASCSPASVSDHSSLSLPPTSRRSRPSAFEVCC